MDDTRTTTQRDESTGTAGTGPRPGAGASNIAGARVGNTAPCVLDTYDVAPIESPLELEEIVRLRAELTWADWKTHPRFKKDRMIREAQRRWGVAAEEVPLLPLAFGDVRAANDIGPVDSDAELAADPDFVTVCDARRDAWIAALESEGESEGDGDQETAGEPRRAGG